MIYFYIWLALGLTGTTIDLICNQEDYKGMDIFKCLVVSVAYILCGLITFGTVIYELIEPKK